MSLMSDCARYAVCISSVFERSGPRLIVIEELFIAGSLQKLGFVDLLSRVYADCYFIHAHFRLFVLIRCGQMLFCQLVPLDLPIVLDRLRLDLFQSLDYIIRVPPIMRKAWTRGRRGRVRHVRFK